MKANETILIYGCLVAFVTIILTLGFVSCARVERVTQQATLSTIEDCMRLCHPFGVKELQLDKEGVKCECQRKD